ncbi:MAG: chloride channel protein [Gammaproteobacteria bacterium]|jgi:chloride channel protein, CIC family|nr:chloride channel protein [Gammaproteobacteria bacterium]
MHKVIERIKAYLEAKQLLLAGTRGVWLLALLGLLSGVIVGMIVILFRLLIETTQSSFLPDGDPEHYELLQWTERLLLPMTGGVVLGLLFLVVSRAPVRLGVIHVMERLAYHEGHLSARTALMQFFGGALAIISGHSVGREGPSIHLGAATASLMGQWLRLPNNSIRTLVACGASAAIAASFNTPLAGVIFAMEVIMMEYTISGFTPIILAAVSATTLNRLAFDSLPTFIVPELALHSFWELLAIVAMGIGIGALAAVFIVLLNWITKKTRTVPIFVRMSLGGTAVGICAIAMPQVMGIGYDTVNAALFGDMLVVTLSLVLLAKLVATAISVGMGIPAGLIGPTLFMGAMFGSAVGQFLVMFSPNVSHPGLYTILGMGAMMGATLQAPLAALLALLELTGNVDIIFPGMLAIVSANLAAKELFKQDSVYLVQMQSIGLDYHHDPLSQSLRRRAVGSVMNTSFSLMQTSITRIQAEKILLADKPDWLIINRDEGKLLMPAADLARFIEDSGSELAEDELIDLLEIPSRRQQLAAVRQQSTLQQAFSILDKTDAEALYVIRPLGSVADRIYGIVTREHIEKSYRLSTSAS